MSGTPSPLLHVTHSSITNPSTRHHSAQCTWELRKPMAGVLQLRVSLTTCKRTTAVDTARAVLRRSRWRLFDLTVQKKRTRGSTARLLVCQKPLEIISINSKHNASLVSCLTLCTTSVPVDHASKPGSRRLCQFAQAFVFKELH